MDSFTTEPGAVFWVVDEGGEGITIFDEPLAIVLIEGGNTSLSKTTVNRVLLTVISTRASKIPESFVMCHEGIGWIQNTWLAASRKIV